MSGEPDLADVLSLVLQSSGVRVLRRTERGWLEYDERARGWRPVYEYGATIAGGPVGTVGPDASLDQVTRTIREGHSGAEIVVFSDYEGRYGPEPGEGGGLRV